MRGEAIEKKRMITRQPSRGNREVQGPSPTQKVTRTRRLGPDLSSKKEVDKMAFAGIFNKISEIEKPIFTNWLSYFTGNFFWDWDQKRG
jgi:hypothetical protein